MTDFNRCDKFDVVKVGDDIRECEGCAVLGAER